VTSPNTIIADLQAEIELLKSDNQVTKMTNEEQHEYLVGILTKLVPVLDCDELSCLAHHLGISVDEFYYPTTNMKEAA
jgi:hypothetical protein